MERVVATSMMQRRAQAPERVALPQHGLRDGLAVLGAFGVGEQVDRIESALVEALRLLREGAAQHVGSQQKLAAALEQHGSFVRHPEGARCCAGLHSLHCGRGAAGDF